jgi:hypothetical protein
MLFPSGQHFPKVADHLVPAELAQGPVKGGIGICEPVGISTRSHQLEFVDVVIQELHLLLAVAPCHDGPRCGSRLQGESRFDQVVDPLLRNRAQANPLIRLVDDKTLALKDPQRLAHRDPADAETLRELSFDDPISRKNAARCSCRNDLFDDHVDQCAGFQWSPSVLWGGFGALLTRRFS